MKWLGAVVFVATGITYIVKFNGPGDGWPLIWTFLILVASAGLFFLALKNEILGELREELERARKAHIQQMRDERDLNIELQRLREDRAKDSIING